MFQRHHVRPPAALPETNEQRLPEQEARLLVEDAGMTFEVEYWSKLTGKGR